MEGGRQLQNRREAVGSTGLRHTLTLWAIVMFAVLIAWFMFKLVLHLVAALFTGILVLALALYVYFKFFRRTRAS
jgi:hypothetical protein